MNVMDGDRQTNDVQEKLSTNMNQFKKLNFCNQSIPVVNRSDFSSVSLTKFNDDVFSRLKIFIENSSRLPTCLSVSQSPISSTLPPGSVLSSSSLPPFLNWRQKNKNFFNEFKRLKLYYRNKLLSGNVGIRTSISNDSDLSLMMHSPSDFFQLGNTSKIWKYVKSFFDLH